MRSQSSGSNMPALMDEGVRTALAHAGFSRTGSGARGSYMSTMEELRGGLTEGQKAHKARQRLQLQRDLEQQVGTCPCAAGLS